MTVLQGFTYGPITCGECGCTYISIETTGSPEIVRLRCWLGCIASAPRNDPLIQQALGKSKDKSPDNEERTIRCPDPSCPVTLPENDLQAQADHMERLHPEIIAKRNQLASRHDGWD